MRKRTGYNFHAQHRVSSKNAAARDERRKTESVHVRQGNKSAMVAMAINTLRKQGRTPREELLAAAILLRHSPHDLHVNPEHLRYLAEQHPDLPEAKQFLRAYREMRK